jgi:ATP-dependent Lon protease
MPKEGITHQVNMNGGGSRQQPSEIPILPVREMLVFPKMIVPVVVMEERFIKLVDDALVEDRIIGLVAIRETKTELQPEDLYQVGVVSLIHKMLKMPDESQRLLVQGISRMRVKEYVQREPYYRARIEHLEDEVVEDIEMEALTVNIKGLFKKLIEMSPHLPPELGLVALNVESPADLADLVAANIQIKLEDKQEILETLNVKERLEKVHRILNKEIQVLELGTKIQSEAKGQMDKLQREFYLREQLKAIQKELGETDERTQEILELREKLDKAKLPDEARTAAGRELDTPSQGHTWTGFWSCPGRPAPKIIWISIGLGGYWIRITTTWKKSRNELWNIWRSGS